MKLYSAMKNEMIMSAGKKKKKRKRKMVVIHEISQVHKDKPCMFSVLCGIWGKEQERRKRQKQRKMRKSDRGGCDQRTSWSHASVTMKHFLCTELLRRMYQMDRSQAVKLGVVSW